MRFSLTLFVSTLAALASCQSGPNAFDIPPAGDYLLNAGQPTTFTWSNLSGSTVTLTLRDGPNGDLNAGSVIVGTGFPTLSGFRCQYTDTYDCSESPQHWHIHIHTTNEHCGW